MTLRRRLLLAQLPLAAALVLVGAASLRTVSRLADSSANILADNYRSVLAAQHMSAALDQLDRLALLRGVGRPHPGAGGDLRDRFEAELRVQEGNITETGEREATGRLRLAWESYQRADRAAGAAPDPLAALGELQGASAQIRSIIDEIVALNQDAMVRKSNQASRTSDRLLRLLLAATLAALGLGLLASGAMTARMVRPLSRLSLAVRRFGEGDLEARVRPAEADEIAALGREFDLMADRLEQYRRSSLGDLLRAQQASQAAIDSLPDPVLVFDTGDRVLHLNRAAGPLLRLPPGEGVGLRLGDLDPEVRERLARVKGHVLAGKGAYAPRGFDEALRVESPGGPRRYLPRATALYSDDGAVTGVAVVLQDVTRLMRFDELKDDLVATVAHEFRTPLTSLHMAIHLLAEEAAGPLAERQADLTAAARQDCERLQGIVDDLLDLSRIQAGRIELHAQSIGARSLLAQAAAGVEQAARAAQVSLIVDSVDGELTVVADPERGAVVLANLLANALRHTPAGGRITARVRPAGGAARFEVEDTGEGIAPAYHERVFERFFQVPGARRGGVGLGLYLAREIVRAHGGEMGLVSAPGRGSTFWFTLPLGGAGTS